MSSQNPLAALPVAEEATVRAVTAAARALERVGTDNLDDAITRLKHAAAGAHARIANARKILATVVGAVVGDLDAFAAEVMEDLSVDPVQQIMGVTIPLPLPETATETVEEGLTTLTCHGDPDATTSTTPQSANGSETPAIADTSTANSVDSVDLVPEVPMGENNPGNSNGTATAATAGNVRVVKSSDGEAGGGGDEVVKKVAANGVQKKPTGKHRTKR